MTTHPPIRFDPIPESRYDRQELISWWDQRRLSKARVIVAGAGALGNEVLKLLALVGVGHIQVIDFDTISPSNLARMVLFRPSDVGRFKVEVAVERLREINPELDLCGINGDLRFALGLGDYRRADLVFGCLDSVNARWALNRKCLQAGVEWIDAGISDYHGLIARYAPTTGACYECNFTETTRRRFDQRYSCPFGLLNDVAENKVPTTAISTSIIAALQVQQALLMLHGQDDQALQPGERLMVYLKPFQMVRDRLPANPDCLAHQPLPPQIPALNCSPGATIREATRLARLQQPAIRSLKLPYDLVTAFSCPTCGASEPVLRPREQVHQSESTCPACGQMRLPETISSIPADSIHAGETLGIIGIPSHEILTFETDGEEKYFQLTD